jgi:hypothetical protein
MNLTQLKKWINELPEEELGNYNVVFRTIKELDTENWCAYDIPIVASGIDYGNKELYLCNEKSCKIIDKG